jgi:hypothetical protein
VGITGTPNVAISGTPAVSITGTPSVNSTETPAPPTPYTVVTTAGTNAAAIKGSAGSLFEISVSNLTAATIYVKLYNMIVAPTVGTNVPMMTIPVAAGAFLPVQYSQGKRFTSGISIAVTGAAAATDTTNVAAGAQISASYL